MMAVIPMIILNGKEYKDYKIKASTYMLSNLYNATNEGQQKFFYEKIFGYSKKI